MRIRNKELRQRWHRKEQKIKELKREAIAGGPKPKAAKADKPAAPAKKAAAPKAEKPKAAPKKEAAAEEAKPKKVAKKKEEAAAE